MNKNVNVLLVEDDTVDVESVQKEFEKNCILNPLYVAKDGIVALDMLRSKQVLKPYMILLDLNMPRMGGFEFLKEIRSDSDLRSAVVFIITTSDNDRDKAEAYGYNVSGYIRKESLGEDFMQLTTLCQDFWRVVEFPV